MNYNFLSPFIDDGFSASTYAYTYASTSARIYVCRIGEVLHWKGSYFDLEIYFEIFIRFVNLIRKTVFVMKQVQFSFVVVPSRSIWNFIIYWKKLCTGLYLNTACIAMELV